MIRQRLINESNIINPSFYHTPSNYEIKDNDNTIYIKITFHNYILNTRHVLHLFEFT